MVGGLAWFGFGFGLVWLGLAFLGLTWLGLACFGLVWLRPLAPRRGMPRGGRVDVLTGTWVGGWLGWAVGRVDWPMGLGG